MRWSEVIRDARDLHQAFDRKSTPDAVARRFLARYQQGLLVELHQWKRDLVHLSQEIPLPLADFAEGATLVKHLGFPHGGTAYFLNPDRRPVPLAFQEEPMRLRRFMHPAVYVRDGVLYLLGEETDWTEFETLTLDLFPAGPDTITDQDESLLPGQPLRACVEALGQFMAGRAPDGAGAVTQGMIDSYIDEVTQRRRAVVGQINEVW